MKRKVVERVDYDGFLNCLIRIAPLCYPNTRDGDGAMLHLLMDNLLPLASRRSYYSITHKTLSQPALHGLQGMFRDSLSEVFDFYAANTANSATAKNLAKTATGGGNKPKTFDDHGAQVRLCLLLFLCQSLPLE